MEHGGQDDGYDYSQNHYLNFEHAGRDHNFVFDKTNISVIKSDENLCEMARSAETNDLIEKTDWGNKSSMKHFLMENQSKHAGIQSVVSNATKHQDQKKETLIIIFGVRPCLIICSVKRLK
jgi:hypothetical protein